MSQILQIALHIALSAIGLAFFTWLMVVALKRSDDPAKIIFKATFSVALIIGEFFFVRKMLGMGGGGGEAAGYAVAMVAAGSIAACGFPQSLRAGGLISVWPVRWNKMVSAPEVRCRRHIDWQTDWKSVRQCAMST